METYETCAKGIRILPGQWRPHYPWEHIAWVSPPWPSQDYLWLDLPEAIFCEEQLFYLSHTNPRHPSLFPDLPQLRWQKTNTGIAYERILPNDVRFGASVEQHHPNEVSLKLYLFNGGNQTLTHIRLQICVFLRAIKEFAPHDLCNKSVHRADGWVRLDEVPGENGNGYHDIGASGPGVADQPVITTMSSNEERLVAFTWGKHTNCLWSNPVHPCMHADPCISRIEPGQQQDLNGALIFFKGSIDAFGRHFAQRQQA